MEMIPMGPVLAVLIKQVLKTAEAAKDVLIEKESFKVLSKHLFDIEPMLKELQLKKLNDSEATRLALQTLEADVKRANSLVEKYKDRARFYLLVKCRHIVSEVQEVTRDIGRSLAAFSLANADVLSGMSSQVNKLHNEMQSVEFEASSSHFQIVDKLHQGIRDQKLDQEFANLMLEEIATAVGVPVEHSQISKELENFRNEKEEAAKRKERAEVFFLEQVIELLSRADAARDFIEVKNQYFQRLQAMERYAAREEQIAPFTPFLCAIKRTVMIDPVSLCTGTTCERAAIEEWFDHGKMTDPETGEILKDRTLRSNLPLRQSIEEWRELNYCLRIRACKEKLLSGSDASVEEALNQMQDLMTENSINKDWICIEELTDIVITILGSSSNTNLKRKILVTLKYTVKGHARNKEKVIEYGVLDDIIPCLAHDSNVAKDAVELLHELLQDRCTWNVSACRKLSTLCGAVGCLVALLSGPVRESATYAETILKQLFEVDEESISQAAKSGWYRPLIDRLVQGPVSSRVSMVRALVNMELVDSDLKLLGKEGIVPPLLEMLASGNMESKELALSALIQLSSCRANKGLIASAGGLPLILKMIFSTRLCAIVLGKCCQVLEKLSSNDDGTKFFVDGNGTQLELEPIINSLLAMKLHNVQRPALRALLGICKSDPVFVKTAVLNTNGLTLVLPLLDETDSEIREIALNLLFLFSYDEPLGVVEYLLKPKRLEALVGFLENDNNNNDVQTAAAGLLANLPKSEASITTKLIELDGLNALVNIVRTGTMKAIENALSALFRFTDPVNLEVQRKVVDLGTYDLLVNLLKTGSVLAKARAAALLGELSKSSPKLVVMNNTIGCLCFRPKHPHQCAAHGGTCSVETTFCLVQANALPNLIELLQGRIQIVAHEAIHTLSTLVQESCPNRGASALHEANAIKPVLDVLRWGQIL
ncbi:hypothetical protein K2173_013173 [Erythroxylum novogranatense]|uniref:RING-type E3 ubiquitin transferase n=1 Tax=Erythroxylum novogranatense TaxID=1862640 RepID=A0AAV8TF15_9ROSI|nr:hypothetical protein K2173_013173 [Erythroxylum novogranatense]